MTRLKKGDQVVVLAGAQRGETGRILHLDRKHDQAVVEGVNMKYKHVRKSQDMPQGGRTRREYPVDVSNLAYYDAESGKGVRLGARLIEGAGKVEKVRVMRPSGKQIED